MAAERKRAADAKKRKEMKEKAQAAHEGRMMKLKLEQKAASIRSERAFEQAWSEVCDGKDGIVAQVEEYLHLRGEDVQRVVATAESALRPHHRLPRTPEGGKGASCRLVGLKPSTVRSYCQCCL